MPFYQRVLIMLLPMSLLFCATDASGEPVNLMQEVGIDQKLNAQLPLDAPFRNEEGEVVALGDFCREKPLVLALVYFKCPMLCGLEMEGLVRSLRSLSLDAGSDFEVLVVSFNPDEGPELAAEKKRSVLARYDRRGAENGWQFLTGEPKSIGRLTEAVGFRYVPDDSGEQFAHAAGVVLVTPEGRTSRYFYGVEFPARDLRLGLVEASHNKIGTPTDRILLFCYHYNPTTGKYGLAIWNIVRAAGAATVLAMTVGIARLLRRERRTSGASRKSTGSTLQENVER